MKRLLIGLILSVSFIAQSQFVPSGGIKLGIIQSSVSQLQGIYSRSQFQGQQFDYYFFNHDLGTLAGGVHLRGYGAGFLSDKKFRPGYSLEIGVQQFASQAVFTYHSSSTTDPDSIVNDFDGERTRTNYTTVQFKHFLDLNWNLSSKLKWSNSLGIGLQALVRSGSLSFPNTNNAADASLISQWTPPLTLTFTYDCQFTEKYDKVDVGYFVTYDFLSLNLFKSEQTITQPTLGDLSFLSFGFRIIPHPRKKKGLSHEH